MDPPATSGDEGIRCLTCAYNLTGVASNRCPECGAPFNRRKLLRDAYLGRGPIPHWSERGDQNKWLCLLRTIVFVIFSPRKVVTSLPNRPDLRAARSFSTHCYILAACLVIAPLLVKPGTLLGILPVLLGVFVGAVICQILVSAVILQANYVESPHVDRTFAFYESLGCLFAAYLPVTALAIGMLEFVSIVLRYPASSPLVIGCIISILICNVWWIIGLGIATWSLETRISEAVVAFITLPFLLIIAAMVGGFVVTILGLFVAVLI